MSSVKEQLSQLENTIHNFPGHELRYHFMYLHDTLQAEFLKKGPEAYQPILIAKAQQLAESIVETNTISLSDMETFHQQHKKIASHYCELADVTKVNTIPMKITQAVLNIGGALVGIMTSIVGGVLGIPSGLIGSKNKAKGLLAGLSVGVLTGAMIGFIIGFRSPKKILKDQFTRRLKISMDQVHQSINSLQKDLIYFNKHITDIRQELLTHYQGDQVQLQTFENSNHEFEIASIDAKFFHSALKGFVGQHGFIRCQLPHKTTILELGGPTPENQIVSQSEKRILPGKKILEMIAAHRTLNEKYGIRINNIMSAVDFYKPGERDCHTYLNMILNCVGESEIKIERFPKKSFWLSQLLVGKTTQWTSAKKDNRA